MSHGFDTDSGFPESWPTQAEADELQRRSRATELKYYRTVSWVGGFLAGLFCAAIGFAAYVVWLISLHRP